jgi:hypothetical protein
MRLTGRICRIDDVSSGDREQMFSLMRRHYENVDRHAFESDFDQKDWVIVATDVNEGRVYGFSTQTLYRQEFNGQSVRILFSGDTIVDRRFWASNPLSQLWGRLALSLIDAYPDDRLYWFLISKGYKTYRFLPVFFREFYPRYDKPTPRWAKRLICEVSSTRYGHRFKEPTGIVVASRDGCRLRQAVADVTPDRLRNPHVAFFDRVNPGHAGGDELCCVAPLSRENFNRKAFRVIGATDEVSIGLDLFDRDSQSAMSGG